MTPRLWLGRIHSHARTRDVACDAPVERLSIWSINHNDKCFRIAEPVRLHFHGFTDVYFVIQVSGAPGRIELVDAGEAVLPEDQPSRPEGNEGF